MSKLLTARHGGRLTLFIGLLLVAMAFYVSRAEAISAGESVVGIGKLPSAPNLIINASGGNDVVYIQAQQPPAAYGGGPTNVINDCAEPDTIADVGSGTYAYTTKKHQYSFEFTKPARSFSLLVLDWGDFLPYAPDQAVLGIGLTGLDANNNVVASSTFSFTVFAGNDNNRPSSLGALGTRGDACTATEGQPGRLPLAITAPPGKTIAKVTLNFADQASMDPHVAITRLRYTLLDKDDCKDGQWQLFTTPRSFKNQGDCVSFVNTGR